MIEKLTSNQYDQDVLNQPIQPDQLDCPITIFTIPKAFEGHFGLIQRNAIRSWIELGLDVIVLGDDAGVAQTAAELGARHLSGLVVNEHGTPLINDAFRLAGQQSTSPILAYCNADVILLKDFVDSVSRIKDSEIGSKFLMIGRRTNLNIEREIQFSNRDEIQRLKSELQSEGQLGPVVCKEYFVFNRDLFQDVPALAVGRGNWDNWMVADAKSKGVAVIDATDSTTAIHQEHDYSHTQDNRMACYVSGEEARENQRLAGGRNLIKGSTADWKLNAAGQVRACRMRWMHLGFWRDLPRFSKLLINLFSSRKR